MLVDNQHVFVAWPNPGAHLTMVAMTLVALENVAGKKSGDTVAVTGLLQTVHLAAEIYLLSRYSFCIWSYSGNCHKACYPQQMIHFYLDSSQNIIAVNGKL